MRAYLHKLCSFENQTAFVRCLRLLELLPIDSLLDDRD